MSNLPDADEVGLGIIQPCPTIDASTSVSDHYEYYEHIYKRMRRIWGSGMRWDWAVGERLARFGWRIKIRPIELRMSTSSSDSDPAAALLDCEENCPRAILIHIYLGSVMGIVPDRLPMRSRGYHFHPQSTPTYGYLPYTSIFRKTTYTPRNTRNCDS